jgi:hypothetical protein
MAELLTGQRAFAAHLQGSEGVPRIEVAPSELGAMRQVLREWTSGPTGTADLGEPEAASHWALPVPAQGPPPEAWSGLERSLHPGACGTCHPRQYYDWKDSLHARAYSFGFEGDMLYMGNSSCVVCHAPLTEQISEPALRVTGVNCAGCHVRSHARHGPPLAAVDLLEPERSGAHGGVRRDDYFQDSAFCMRCHQLLPHESLLRGEGSLMNTFEEWKTSPAAAEGRTCQSCHMPDRRHLWRGIHDPATMRQNLTLAVEGRRILVTSSAGHFAPTYTVPLILVSAWLEDVGGREIEATRRAWPIQRKVRITAAGAGDHEIHDTRLAPGETRAFDYDVSAAGGVSLVVSVDVEPDAAYVELYRQRLSDPQLTDEMRRLFGLALERPLAPPFNVTVVRSPLDGSSARALHPSGATPDARR